MASKAAIVVALGMICAGMVAATLIASRPWRPRISPSGMSRREALEATAPPTIETKLAVTDGKPFDRNRPLSHEGEMSQKRIRFLLDSVSKSSGMSREVVAEKVYRGRQHLSNKFGRDVLSETLLEKLHAAYLSGVTEGRTFDEVLVGIILILGN